MVTVGKFHFGFNFFCFQICRDCSHALTFLPILLTILLGLALVVIVLFLNLGASPTFDSLLFFVQVQQILTLDLLLTCLCLPTMHCYK